MEQLFEIDVLTIFPDVVRVPLSESIMGRAMSSGIVRTSIHDLRDWTNDNHKKVDDEPYGGGPGMVMKPEPFFSAVNDLKKEDTKVVLMTPQGKRFNQKKKVPKISQNLGKSSKLQESPRQFHKKHESRRDWCKT